jgi:hypothetical protein
MRGIHNLGERRGIQGILFEPETPFDPTSQFAPCAAKVLRASRELVLRGQRHPLSFAIPPWADIAQLMFFGPLGLRSEGGDRRQ